MCILIFSIILYGVGSSTIRNGNYTHIGGFHNKCLLPKLNYRNKCLTSGIESLLHLFDLTKGKFFLDRQLNDVKVYVAVDGYNNPIVSYYPTDKGCKKWTKPQPKSNKITRTPSTTKTLLSEFFKLFDETKRVAKDVTRHNIGSLDSGLPDVVLYFMDPNACTAHVNELKRQHGNVKIKTTSLSGFFSKWSSEGEIHPILLPLPDSLVYVTNKSSGGTFDGTPVFTTNPPIVKTVKSSKADEFNPATDQFLVFFTAAEAGEFYKKVWWKGTLEVNKNDSTEYYKILGKSKTWIPEIKFTSLEHIYSIVTQSSPFWGYLIKFVVPEIKLNEDTKLLVDSTSGVMRLIGKIKVPTLTELKTRLDIFKTLFTKHNLTRFCPFK